MSRGRANKFFEVVEEKYPDINIKSEVMNKLLKVKGGGSDVKAI